MQLWLCCFEHSVHRESRSLSFRHLYSFVTHAPVYQFVLFVHRMFCMGFFFLLMDFSSLVFRYRRTLFLAWGDCLADGSQRKPCFRVTVETTGSYFFSSLHQTNMESQKLLDCKERGALQGSSRETSRGESRGELTLNIFGARQAYVVMALLQTAAMSVMEAPAKSLPVEVVVALLPGAEGSFGIGSREEHGNH